MSSYTGVQTTAADVTAPGSSQNPDTANQPATVVLAAAAGQAWYLGALRWSYSATPTNGQVQIAWTDPTVGAVTEVYYITTGGASLWMFNPRRFPPGTTVTVTLTAGGGSVHGTLYVDAWSGT